MRTTIDLPDELLEQTKIAAVKRRTSVKGLIVAGLQCILSEDFPPVEASNALARLQSGYHLGGKPLSREQAHAR